MLKRSRIMVIKGAPHCEDAELTILVPTISEYNANQKAVASAGGEGSEAAEEVANTYLARHVLDWNWPDDEGEPLPKPHGNPEVFKLLTMPELMFIGRALSGTLEQQAAARKNLRR